MQSVLSGKPQINAEAVGAFLSELVFPLHFLDYETYASAVPLIDGASPHKHFPVQYSLHVQEEDGTPVHREYLRPWLAGSRSGGLRSSRMIRRSLSSSSSAPANQSLLSQGHSTSIPRQSTGASTNLGPYDTSPFLSALRPLLAGGSDLAFRRQTCAVAAAGCLPIATG